ncbi:MAG: anti-sigma factor [Burkholderiaceae bacterium]|jgi:sigma-E factor negative regulatory protein RseA|nr:anti-sigma factor [Burkholderiaceae bacterium]
MKHINDNLEIGAPDGADAGSISALMDGALAGQDAAAALTAAMQPEGQERWQLYHLIGDTLRAADLAAHHDAALLTGIRAALQQPALTPDSALPLATARHEAANDGVFRWKLASGLAAAVAVAAIGWNVWGLAGTPPSSQLAQTQPEQRLSPRLAQPRAVELAALGASAGATASSVPAVAVTASDGEPQMMLRDPQLDRLLVAHRRMAAFGGSPSAFLRNATFEEPQR